MTEPLFTDKGDVAAIAALSGRPEMELKWPKLLAEMVDVVHAELQRAGQDQDAAAKIARLVMLALGRHFGGMSFYLPTGASLARALRDDEIFRQFGIIHAEDIARAYGITLQRTYQIIGEQLAMRRRAEQPDLFSQSA